MDKWIKKQRMNGKKERLRLVSLQEREPVTCNNTDGTWRQYVKWNKSGRKTNINATLGHLILKDEDTFWGQCCYAISLLYKHQKVLHKCRWTRSHLMWPLNTRNTVNTRFTEGHLANVRLPVLCARTTAITVQWMFGCIWMESKNKPKGEEMFQGHLLG